MASDINDMISMFLRTLQFILESSKRFKSLHSPKRFTELQVCDGQNPSSSVCSWAPCDGSPHTALALPWETALQESTLSAPASCSCLSPHRCTSLHPCLLPSDTFLFLWRQRDTHEACVGRQVWSQARLALLWKELNERC